MTSGIQERVQSFNLGPAERIPLGEGRSFCVGERDVAVFRTRGGDLYATQATCPHRGGPLADGTLGGESLICPLHAFKFNVATGAALGAGCEDLATYRVELTPEGDVRLFVVA